jgi:DNA-binding MarR family transcriptional regulator
MSFDPIREARRQWVAHGWEDAADGMAMVTSLVRAQQLVMERVDAVLRPLDLTLARFEVLRLLSFVHSGALPMTRLGSLLQVHPTSVTSIVQRLEASGLVRRLPHPEDGRAVLAEITPAGRELVERATADLVADEFGLGALDQEQLGELSELLRPVRAAAGDFSPDS